MLEVAVAVTMAAAAVAFAVGMVGLVILTCRRPCPPTPKVAAPRPATLDVIDETPAPVDVYRPELDAPRRAA